MAPSPPKWTTTCSAGGLHTSLHRNEWVRRERGRIQSRFYVACTAGPRRRGYRFLERRSQIGHVKPKPGKPQLFHPVLLGWVPRASFRKLIHHAEQAHPQVGHPRFRLAFGAVSEAEIPPGGTYQGERGRRSSVPRGYRGSDKEFP